MRVYTYKPDTVNVYARMHVQAQCSELCPDSQTVQTAQTAQTRGVLRGGGVREIPTG